LKNLNFTKEKSRTKILNSAGSSKSQEQRCEAFGSLNSGGASSPRATATGSAWVHAPQQENSGVWSGFLLSSLFCQR
jgi:hypothetical protein